MKGQPNSNPFRRAKLLVAQIRAIMSTFQNEADRRVALNALGEYRSRGHGRNAPTRNVSPQYSKYMPHQGKKECARRRGQLS